MYHICYSNPEVWPISYKSGVYGNVQSGNHNEKVFWGKLIDLLIIKPGDKVFFYIKNEGVLRGVFEVVDEPFYCQDNLFKNPQESYPFRFYFKEIKNFPKPIPALELAYLIENSLITSINTFERDANASFRGIRQITFEEGLLIEKLFLKFNPKTDFSVTTKYNYKALSLSIDAVDLIERSKKNQTFTKEHIVTFTKVPIKKVSKTKFVTWYENSLQGYISYCLRRNLNNVETDLGVNNFTECMLEIPLLRAQQFRSDILCLYRHNTEKPHFYSIIEAKKDREITVKDLSQLIGYIKTFAEAKGIPFNSVEGVYLSNSFEKGAVEYLKSRKEVEKENPIRLIGYSVNNFGMITFNELKF